MTDLLPYVFLAAVGVLLLLLAAWGWTVWSMTVRLDRAHPEVFEELRARSRRAGRRAAVTAELQKALSGRGADLPEALRGDAVFERLRRREERLRWAMLALALVAGIAFFAL